MLTKFMDDFQIGFPTVSTYVLNIKYLIYYKFFTVVT